MKLKKVLALVAGTTVAVSSFSFAAAASYDTDNATVSVTVPTYAAEAEETSEAVTFTFDTSEAEDYFSLIDTTNVAKISYKQSVDTGISGGSLRVTCDLADDITTENGDFEGIELLASSFDVESFAGYKITVNISVPEEAASAMGYVQLFCSGEDETWEQSDLYLDGNTDTWQTLTLTCPASSAPNKIGIKLPVVKAYDGVLCYIDDVEILDANGDMIPNIDGDNSGSVNPNAPTFSFDRSGAASYFSLIDTANTANITYKQSTQTRVSGGSFRVACNLENEITTENGDYEGIMLTADKFGITNFAGYKINLYIYFPAEVSPVMSYAQLFCKGNDGSWKQTNINVATSVDSWSLVTLICPADAAPDTIGLKLPVVTPYEGALCFIDNIEIYDADGNKLPNIDGYDENASGSVSSGDLDKIETPVITTPATTTSAQSSGGNSSLPIIIIVVVVAVLVVAAVVVLIIMKAKRSYY